MKVTDIISQSESECCTPSYLSAVNQTRKEWRGGIRWEATFPQCRASNLDASGTLSSTLALTCGVTPWPWHTTCSVFCLCCFFFISKLNVCKTGLPRPRWKEFKLFYGHRAHWFYYFVGIKKSQHLLTYTSVAISFFPFMFLHGGINADT